MILQKKKYQIFLFLSLICLLSAQQTNKCCLTYDKTNVFCLSCPEPAYIFGNNCILNIDNCKKYSDCFSCTECESGFKLSDFQIKGIKTKQCLSTVLYTKIDLQKLEGRPGQAFNITNQYMNAYHLKQLRNSKAHSGFLSKYENGSEIMQIQYQVNEAENQQNKYYRGIMHLDGKTFNFNELEFKQIQKSQLNSNINKNNPIKNKQTPMNTGGIIGVQSKNQQFTETQLNLNANQNQNMIQQINQIAQGPKTIYNRVLKILIKTFINNSQIIQVSYQRTDNAIQRVNIDPQTRRVLNIKQPQTKFMLAKAENNLALNITKQSQLNNTNKSNEVLNIQNTTKATILVATQSNNTFWPKSDPKGYQKQNNINLLKNTNFLVCYDILRKNYKGYTDILPKEGYVKTEGDTQYFLLYFQKLDNNRVEIFSRIKQKINGQIVHEHVIGKVEKVVDSRKYTSQEVSEVTKSMYFIPTAVQMKKTSQKYVVSKIKYVGVNEEQPNNIYFQVIFCNDGVLTEVQVQTKKKLRTSKVLSEKPLKLFQGIVCKTEIEEENERKTLQQSKNENFSSDADNNSSSQNQTSILINNSTNTTSLSSHDPPGLKVQQNLTISSVNLTNFSNNVGNIGKNQIPQDRSLITKQNKTLINNTITSKNQSNQASLTTNSQETNKSFIPTTNQVKVSSEGNSSGNRSKINISSEIPKNLSQSQVGASKISVNSSSQVQKNIKQTISLGSSIQKCLPTDLPPQILTQITGFNQIIQQDVRIKKILDFIQKNQSPRLDKSCIMAYFHKLVGLTTQYKIYFSVPNFGILEVFLVSDTLKSRMYILNITPIILNANGSN